MENLKYRFYHPLQVRFADTDAQGHVFFGNYLTYFDEALVAYLRATGFPWQNLHAMGLDSYYVDAGCQYKGRAIFEDMLHVHTKMKQIGNTSFTAQFAIFKENSEALIASGHITSVCVNPKTHRPTPVPDALRQAIAQYEKQSY